MENINLIKAFFREFYRCFSYDLINYNNIYIFNSAIDEFFNSSHLSINKIIIKMKDLNI